MSWLSKLFRKMFGSTEVVEDTIYEKGVHQRIEFEEIHSIWDYLRFRENTQAYHLNAVTGFEEWISMEEILRRIRELFNVDYKNDRSLYPYIKTLVDCGLLETIDVGGKRKWRKKDLIIKIAKKEAKHPPPKKETIREREVVKQKGGSG